MGLAAEAVHAILREQVATLVRSGAWRGASLRPTPI
jgi:hypothetical protein